MPATFGVTVIPEEFTTPTGCVIKKLADKSSLETSEVLNEVGVTVRNIPHKLITREVSIDLTGAAPLTLVVAGDFEEGVLSAVRVGVKESNEGPPESTVTMKSYATAA